MLLLRQQGEVSILVACYPLSEETHGYVFKHHTLLAVIINKFTVTKDGICLHVLGTASTHEIELRFTTPERLTK
jgi:hypothetical protein